MNPRSARPSANSALILAPILAMTLFPAPMRADDPPCALPKVSAWSLTTDDVKAQALKDLKRDDILNPPANPLAGTEYPTEDLFTQVLNYRANGYGLPAITGDQMTAILGQAHKTYCPADPPGGWVAQSAVPMTTLPQAPYGFFPFWQKNAVGAVPLPVDFNTVQRIGWYGASFATDGSLALPAPDPKRDAAIAAQVALARRFNTAVDLVFSLQEQAKEEWFGLIAGSTGQTTDDFIEHLSSNIANEAGRPLPGFLDRNQSWLLPGPLRSAPTAWDGVTLFLDHFPFGDPNAMGFLNRLLHALRVKLTAKQVWPDSGKPSGFPLGLSLVVPYENLVCVPGGANACTEANSMTIRYLSQLVPRTEDAVGVATTNGGTIDQFIVFLPQPTADPKKDLYQAVETAISQENEADIMKRYPDVSVGTWRLQMERRIVCVLATGTWAWNPPKGYTKPGMQFNDDMVYFQNKFRTVGFWPLPLYGKSGPEAELAAQTRRLFEVPNAQAAQRRIVQAVAGALGTGMTDRFGEYRRDLGLGTEFILLVLALLGVGGVLSFEIADFCVRRKWLLVGLGAVALGLSSLILLFDPALSQYTGPFFAVTLVAIIALPAAWQLLLNRLNQDLP